MAISIVLSFNERGCNCQNIFDFASDGSEFEFRQSKKFSFPIKMLLGTSVTRFGDILPLWQNLKLLWQFLGRLFSIWQNIENTLKDLYGQIIIVVNSKYWTDTVTLLLTTENEPKEAGVVLFKKRFLFNFIS